MLGFGDMIPLLGAAALNVKEWFPLGLPTIKTQTVETWSHDEHGFLHPDWHNWRCTSKPSCKKMLKCQNRTTDLWFELVGSLLDACLEIRG